MWTNLGLQDFSVHVVIGFEDFLCFLLRPGGVKMTIQHLTWNHRVKNQIHPNPPPTHWLSCFQRWKKSCEVISVGWKNLLMVTGSFRVMFCRAPPYLQTRPHKEREDELWESWFLEEHHEG